MVYIYTMPPPPGDGGKISADVIIEEKNETGGENKDENVKKEGEIMLNGALNNSVKLPN
jgi:hypothetical protein